MSSNFLGQWGYTNGILREDSFVHDFDYSPHPGSFGDSGSHWLFQGDLFGLNSQSSFGFDLAEGCYKHADPEPMSPSSVATTPTTSEQPMLTTSSMAVDRESHNDNIDEMDDVDFELTQQLPKKIRRSFTVPSTASYADRNGRKKKYDAPPGVWRNSGGFISTVYINKKRVYGPLRRDVSDAVKDREEMLVAKSVIETEEGMRAFVQAMKERSGPSRNSVSLTDAIESAMMVAHTYSSRGTGSLAANSSSSRQTKRQASVASFFDENIKEDMKDEDVKYEEDHVPSYALASVRVSSRPVRAAAKRNIYLSGGSDEGMDQFGANPDYLSAGLFDTL